MYPPSLHSRPQLWRYCPSPFLAAANLIQRWRRAAKPEQDILPPTQSVAATSIRPFPLP